MMYDTIESLFSAPAIEDNYTTDCQKELDICVNMLDAFARSTYESIYLTDYYRRTFLYVSDNPLFLCGYSPEYIRKAGFAFYRERIPEDNHALLLKVGSLWVSIYQKYPAEERQDFTLSYDIRLTLDTQNTILIHNKSTFLPFSDAHGVCLTLNVSSVSSNKSPGNISLYKRSTNEAFIYDMVKDAWAKQEPLIFNGTEREILALSAQGLGTEAIAARLNRSVDAIKKRKRQIFATLNVNGITEAIVCAQMKKIL